MIRFEDMAPEVMEAMCTPMHQILPIHYPTPVSPIIPSVASVPSTIPPGSLFLGSLSATMDRELLARNRITHIVQVLDVPWLPISEKDGFRCLKIDILDKPTADLRPHLEGACHYIANALSSGGNVLVHCQQGVSRSPAIVIAYLIHNLGMSYDQAYALVKWRRPCINPNPGFVAALRAWESRWRSTGPASPSQFRLAPTPYGYPQITRGISYAGNGGPRP
ncbi:protein-tyrosine phosphatase-like protein [Scleroderma citrinum]